ncbi:MAG: nucleotide exchange factor GrpE [Clostridiales bacterium]|nr:nucleotide exchange factor GrpE [Clostridiales bacterium]
MSKRPHSNAERKDNDPSVKGRSEEQKADEKAVSSPSEEVKADPDSVKETKKTIRSSREDQLKTEISELNDRYVRLLAEYDNYRKRTQKERESLYADAIADVAKEWLPIIDNVERAMCFSIEDSHETAQKVADGVKMIHRQIMEVFDKFGIEEIPCEEGGCFDPNLHEAVLHSEDGELGEQCIAQVFQKGYRTADRIIRHSMVKVVN